MALPVNEKVNRDVTKAMRIWVYGQPNIGKTTFANQWPNALMINTDGNYKRIDSPVISIGANTNVDPWEDFVNNIEEFLKGNHTFDTIVIDLIEDIFQYARSYYCKKLKIDHEADLGYAKAYDIERNAFLMVLRKLANGPYNVILISHEDSTIIKNRVGKETTYYSPAMNDRVMKKIAGMVELTGRVSIYTEVSEDGEPIDHRILYLNSSSEQFGGNKMNLDHDYIYLGYNELLSVVGGVPTVTKSEKKVPIKKETVQKEPVGIVDPLKEEQLSEKEQINERPKMVKRVRKDDENDK